MDCWAIGRTARLAGHVTDRDTFYILPCDARARPPAPPGGNRR
ncbi:MAG: hypothetical protein ACLRWP_18320 [Bilophila wadsworthia]